MPLIRDGAFVDDGFVTVTDDAPLTDAPSIVSLARFKKEREALMARNAPLGIRLKASESPEQLGDDIHHFAVVALEFPIFRDGRAFSWSRILRTRLAYKGEIRSVGHFLYDQLAMLHRVGVNAFEVPDGFALEQFHRAMGEMSDVYQPAADGRRTIRDLRAS
jgi:uncharacterized protein (DUF934 family)